MFTPEERERLRATLIERAAADRRITGVAITGSKAAEREDRWSDIDLAFGVRDAAELPEVLSGWTATMYDQHRAVHHFDVRSGAWIYRVFLLADASQVDLAFVPAEEFRAIAPSFRLVSGMANEPRHHPPQPPEDVIGWGWLYAIHARSSIARQHLWQAEYMISGIRDSALALACIRHDLPSVHGRGLHLLPPDLAVRFEDALVRYLDRKELLRAFKTAMERLIGEVRFVDEALASRLECMLPNLLLDNLGESG